MKRTSTLMISKVIEVDLIILFSSRISHPQMFFRKAYLRCSRRLPGKSTFLSEFGRFSP